MRRRDFLKLAVVAAASGVIGYLLTRPKVYRTDVVIVGGGIAGSTAASILSNHLHVTVIEKSSTYLVGPAKEDILLGLAEPGDYAVKRQPTGEVLAVDPGNRLVYATSGVFQYRYLLLAPGIRLAYERARVRGRFLNMYDDGNVLSNIAAARRGKKIVIAHPGLPYRCTSAPYEMAFLAKWLNPEAEVTVVSGVKYIPQEFADQISGLGELVSSLMSERSIDFIGGAEVVEISEGVLYLDNGEKLQFDNLIWTPPHEGWGWLVESGLAREGEYGYVRVDDRLRARGWDDIYAAGDVIWHVVKTGWAAYFEAQIAAAYILEDAGVGNSKPGFLYSEDAIRLTRDVAVRGAKRWWPIYGKVLWREITGPSKENAEAKYGWMKQMKEIVKFLAA